MTALVARRRHRLQRVGERLHRAEALVLRGRGKRPRVAERHRAESPRLLAGFPSASCARGS